jgi:hypothetical protein
MLGLRVHTTIRQRAAFVQGARIFVYIFSRIVDGEANYRLDLNSCRQTNGAFLLHYPNAALTLGPSVAIYQSIQHAENRIVGP